VSHDHDHGLRGTETKRLIVALGLILAFMAFEVAMAVVASSLALLSDAAHMLTDAAALGLAIFAARLAARPARGAMTYGLGRAEILSAQFNGATLIILAAFIVYEAIVRLVSPPDVKGGIVLVVAIVGVVFNLLASASIASQDQHVDTLVQVGLHSRFAVRGRYSWQEQSQREFNGWLVPRYREGWKKMKAKQA